MNDMRKLIDLIEEVQVAEMPDFDELFVPKDHSDRPLCEALINGRFKNNIHIDAGSHLPGGDIHAHVFGHQGDEILAVKLNGLPATAPMDGCIKTTRLCGLRLMVSWSAT
tara:strand:+ start:313 stop:642 length:330 start_codon:yes stop_codon:yes gene_type:complete